MTGQTEIVPFTVADRDVWHDWLVEHEGISDGVWLRLAKKGTTAPTSLTRQEALEEALCGGWIDGQARSLDAETYLQRFTPRRPRSMWSRRNVELIARLTEQGRMRERGHMEVERARADGRWDRAYPGPATAEAPEELLVALRKVPAAQAAFDRLSRSEWFSALHPILTAPNPGTRDRRIATLIDRLSRPEH